MDGPYGWNFVSESDIRQVLDALRSFESMSWIAIKSSTSHNSHFIAVDSLSQRARQRLNEIEQDDVDQLFSLRLSGLKRIFGFLDNGILSILWWDPEHAVCPSTKS